MLLPLLLLPPSAPVCTPPPPSKQTTARLRHLQSLELSSANQACLDGGMLALCFLPQLTSLCVSLDIPPAFPMALSDLPATLHSLRLGAMWLEDMPQQLADCLGE